MLYFWTNWIYAFITHGCSRYPNTTPLLLLLLTCRIYKAVCVLCARVNGATAQYVHCVATTSTIQTVPSFARARVWFGRWTVRQNMRLRPPPCMERNKWWHFTSTHGTATATSAAAADWHPSSNDGIISLSAMRALLYWNNVEQRQRQQQQQQLLVENLCVRYCLWVHIWRGSCAFALLCASTGAIDIRTT